MIVLTWTGLTFFATASLIVIVVLTALLVLWKIFVGTIDISALLEEPGTPAVAAEKGKASLSRFQFLLFTFVVAGLFLLLSVESGTFVNIPESVLTLLGISAGSYAVSKGISSAETTKKAEVAAKAAKQNPGPANQPNGG